MKTIDLETLKNCLEPDAAVLTGLDDCIIGVNQDNYLVYSYGQFLKHYMFEGMSMSEAIDYVEYNIVGIQGGKAKFDILYETDYMF